MPEHIQTPRLRLRPLTALDAGALFSVFSDAQVMRYFDDPHRTVKDTQGWIAGTLAAPARRTREFAILHDGHVIGKAGIWRAPEIGFLLHRDYWRRGLMHEALSHLIPHLFKKMNLAEITADVDPENTASIRVLTGLGFMETHRAKATIKIGGVWCDSVYFALPRRTMGAIPTPSS